jgi:hypothetical protein
VLDPPLLSNPKRGNRALASASDGNMFCHKMRPLQGSAVSVRGAGECLCGR